MTTAPRLRAPELTGDAWLGTGGRWLTLADLRGRFVLLDFWTLCCVNCHHVLAELRSLEHEFADVLTVIGVHSPKFEHERQVAAVSAAVARHGIAHPVLNDPDMSTWQAYAVRAWPTLVLIDPEGRIIATYSGEGHGHAIAATLRTAIAAATAAGTLQPGVDPYVADEVPTSAYNQPNKVIALDDERLLVSDTGNHRLAIASTGGPNTVVATVGHGERGLIDGSAGDSQFNEPLGLLRLPSDVAAAVDYDVLIADSANHALRGLRLADLTVRTVAGTGAQWMQGEPSAGSATTVALSTPWDLAWHGGAVLIAMAGDHRLWHFDPITAQVAAIAGTTNEGLVDGPAATSWFAQPSAITVADDVAWFVDAETSALRKLHNGTVSSLVGRGLFDFGHVDGRAEDARLQHPLGIALAPDGAVLIADTYNGAIRRYDPASGIVSTVAQGLAEPVDLIVDADGTSMLVLEGAAGRLTPIPLRHGEQVSGPHLTTARPVTVLAPGLVDLFVGFDPPPGQKQDERYGPATQLVVTATPPNLLIGGDGRSVELHRTLQLNANAGDGVLHVAARGASCDDTGEHAACHIHQQDWGIPIVVHPDGDSRLVLALAGGEPPTVTDD